MTVAPPYGHVNAPQRYNKSLGVNGPRQGSLGVRMIAISGSIPLDRKGIHLRTIPCWRVPGAAGPPRSIARYRFSRMRVNRRCKWGCTRCNTSQKERG
jgi:hypothetical protein